MVGKKPSQCHSSCSPMDCDII